MGFFDRVKQAVRPRAAPHLKTSAAGPMIAWSGVGQPKWTPRRYDNLAEEGFRKNVIAYRCVMQIATACASVPWLLYDDADMEVDRHPVLDLLAHPNPLQDGVTFLESVYADLEIAGNAYIEAVRPREDLPPTELYVLRPDRMKIVPGATGLPQGYQYTVNSQVTSWHADPITGASDILHLKRFHPLDDWYGMAPMEAALLSIDQHNAAGAWNQSLLGQGARPSGALVYAPKDGPATLSDDQLQRLREEMGMLYQGDRNAGRPMILEGGLDWKEMSLSPKDMDWLAGRSSAARDIALAFGVPAQMIGIPEAQTYANMAEARLAFYEDTVIPILTRVIAGFDHWLCPMYNDGTWLDFDPDCINALTEKRQAQWSKLQHADFLTRNEKRQAAGYDPVASGDEDDSTDTDPSPAAKFNPNHDPHNGQFTSGDGGGGDNGAEDVGADSSGDDAPDTSNVTDSSQPPESTTGLVQVANASGTIGDVPHSETNTDNTDNNDYPTSKVDTRQAAQQVVDNANGQYLGKNSECASLTHALAPELPAASQWQPGHLVQTTKDIPVGTPIATFNYQGEAGTNGYGPADDPGGKSGYSHTGIYLGQDSSGLTILHQYTGSGGPRIFTIPWGSWGKYGQEGGSRYYTIDY